MTYRLMGWLLVLILLPNCHRQTTTSKDTSNEEALQQQARELAQRFIIVDGHVDLPYRLNITNFRFTKEYIGIPISTSEGDFDFVRARKGGLDAPFMSIYIPASYQKEGGAKEFADSLINMVEGIIEAHPKHFAAGNSPQQIQQNFSKGLLSLPMGMENGAPIEDDLQNVSYFQRRGIRYITLTHSKDNQICDSSYDTTATWGGLSPFGKAVVLEMNRTGIMVDISHVSDSAFYQTLRITKAPVIASHSSCRKYTPGFQRNMNDDMIRTLAKNDGVMMINFGSTFLDATARESWDENRQKLTTILKEAGLKRDDPAAKPIIEQFQKDHPILFADVQKVADHIEHVVKLVGVEHVGFGSDYDGVGDSLPTGLKDVSQYPNLIYELLKRGFSAADIEKICYKNIFRVWQQVEEIAEKS